MMRDRAVVPVPGEPPAPVLPDVVLPMLRAPLDRRPDAGAVLEVAPGVELPGVVAVAVAGPAPVDAVVVAAAAVRFSATLCSKHQPASDCFV